MKKARATNSTDTFAVKYINTSTNTRYYLSAGVKSSFLYCTKQLLQVLKRQCVRIVDCCFVCSLFKLPAFSRHCVRRVQVWGWYFEECAFIRLVCRYRLRQCLHFRCILKYSTCITIPSSQAVSKRIFKSTAKLDIASRT